jgi:hypothetical protein
VGAIGEDKLKDYFLLIDEIDSFQMDASVCERMYTCIAIYKKFPQTMWAMVSATVMPFSDPELESEFKTTIMYDTMNLKPINLYYARNKIRSVTTKLIAQLLKSHPSEKIMVAYNSAAGSFDIGTHLTKKKALPLEEIKIMCSSGGRDKAGGYFAILKKPVLPATLNFVTSAYLPGMILMNNTILSLLAKTQITCIITFLPFLTDD